MVIRQTLFMQSYITTHVFTNAGKYGPEKIQYLDTFHAVNVINKTNRGCSITPAR